MSSEATPLMAPNPDKQPLFNHEVGVDLLDAREARSEEAEDAGTAAGSTLRLGLTCALAYALTYFWRYPIFMLPAEIEAKHVGTLFGVAFDLQGSLSLAFTGGFAIAKPISLSVVTTQFFFRNRLAILLGLLVLGALFEGGGVVLGYFLDMPGMIVLAKFLSSLLSSPIYGFMFTYMEGRQSTEILLAVTTFGYIFAGGASRVTAQAALNAGVPPQLMPLVVGLVALMFACALLWYTDRAPRPSAADVSARSKRKAMSSAAIWMFFVDWWPAVTTLVPAYALLAAMRWYRDLYAKPLFAASLGVKTVPSWFLFVADFPGAFGAVGALLSYSRICDHGMGLRYTSGTFVLCMILTIGSTLLFQPFGLNGGVWQLLAGAGLYVAYSVMGGPVYERMFAFAKIQGTVSLLIFGSDLVGYVVTVTLLLYTIFNENSHHDDIVTVFETIIWSCGSTVLLLVAIAFCYFVWRTSDKQTEKMLARIAERDLVDGIN